ncbi:MAG: hypothetical protein GY758_08850 [Fuerstiella sp.]|jgi:hypothetical protein|nr:hypothetical protein [Fuerstiella sp.]MCP4507655.1 hypothetical protein [Fuerstiella sp.]
MNLPDGFVAEQIYEVPNTEQVSWISMAVDDRGRLITSDQRGGLYRLTVSDDQQPSAPKLGRRSAAGRSA